MKNVSCPCGAEFKTHTEEELFEIINVHARRAHPKDYPKAVAREEARKMMREA